MTLVFFGLVLGPWPDVARAQEASTAARCVPRNADRVLASSARTAVYRVGRRVLACTGARPRRLLVTLTMGRRADVAAVRGSRVAIAGALSAPDAFEGFARFEITKVIDLATDTRFEAQNWGRVSMLRLTAGGAAVGVERRDHADTLFVLSSQGRVVLDRRRTITRVRVQRNRIAWRTGQASKNYNATLQTAELQVQGPVPAQGAEPLPGSFVALHPGRFIVIGLPIPPGNRYDDCYGASSVFLHARSTGERIPFLLRPALNGWCHRILTVTLRATYGPDNDNAPSSCAGRLIPCAGRLDLATLQLPPA